MLILNSLQKDLKESKLVIYEKDKKIHSLKKDLKEKEETIKAREEEERVHCDHLGDKNKIFRSSCLIDLKL